MTGRMVSADEARDLLRQIGCRIEPFRLVVSMDLAHTVVQQAELIGQYNDVRAEMAKWGPDCRSWAALVSENHQQAEQIAAATTTLVDYGHADTCATELSPEAGYPCSCWKADLARALGVTA